MVTERRKHRIQYKLLGNIIWLAVCMLLALPLPALAEYVTWETGRSMPTARFSPRAGAYNNQVYVVGGVTNQPPSASGIVEVYDPAYNSWNTSLSPVSGWIGHSMANTVQNGEVLILAGGSTSGGSNAPQNTIVAYNMRTGSSQQIGTLQNAQLNSNCAVINNRLYIVGGRNAAVTLDTIEMFDLTQPGSQALVVAHLPAARSMAEVKAINNKLYIMGGYDPNFVGTKTCWEWDPTNPGVFRTMADLLHARGGTMAEVVNNKVFLVGGPVAGYPPPVYRSDIQIFDPNDGPNGRWTMGGSTMPTPRYAAAVASIGNKIYVIGGKDNRPLDPNLNTNEIGTVHPSDYHDTPVSDPTNIPVDLGVTGSSHVQFASGTPVQPDDRVAINVSSEGPSTTSIGDTRSLYYDISTSVQYSGNITVTLPYDPALVGDANALKMYHWTGSTWENVTISGSVNTSNNTIQGRVTSLSPFIITEGGSGAGGGSSSVPASSTWSLIIMGLIGMLVLWRAIKRSMA